MKKMIASVFAVVALGFMTSAAQAAPAEIRRPLWDCALTFRAQGAGLQIIVGSYELQGPGEISCLDVEGNREVLPVTVTLGGEHLAARFAVVP